MTLNFSIIFPHSQAVMKKAVTFKQEKKVAARKFNKEKVFQFKVKKTLPFISSIYIGTALTLNGIERKSNYTSYSISLLQIK